MSILITLVGISLLIILHEAGHYAVARACGMRVLRFSLGFGRTLWSRQVGETTYQLALIPLGGYVLIDGMGQAEDDDTNPMPATPRIDTDPRSYRNKPAWQRALVIFAGPAANWLIAALALTVLAGTSGLTHYDESQAVLGELVVGGPAAQAGLRDGDRVLKADGTSVADWAGLVSAIRAHADKPLPLDITRGDAPMQIVVTPKKGGGGYGVIEALPHADVQHFALGGAALAGVHGAWELTVQQGRMLLGMFTGSVGGQLSGLPGIVKAVSKQAELGLNRLLESLAWLSIGLCLLNLTPIPALDGSRLLFLLIEAVRRRPVDERIEGAIHTAGFVLLLGLMIFVSVRDLL